MAEKDKPSPQSGRTPSHLEKEENWLWRLVLLFLVLIATALAAESWERLQSLPYHLGLLSIGVLCVAIAFAGFAYGRRKRVTELKALVREFQERPSAPSEEQLDQLGQLIARSQRTFKELIDSFDDAALALSLDGTIRTANRRITELLGVGYTEAIGHKLEEFLDEPNPGDVSGNLSRFLEKRRWSGMVKVRLRSSQRVLYFDCVLNAIVKAGEVVGASVLARDVTEEREKERRFTELFETLQEGVYFCTPEGKLLDVNPALVRLLGYQDKDELLQLDPKQLNAGSDQTPVLGRSADDASVRTREITLRRKDGSSAAFLDTSRAVWDASGKVVRYQGTLVDVTEQRHMERKLRRQQEFQRRMLESFPDLILVVDLSQTFSFVSSRVRDLLGYTPEELLGKKVQELMESAEMLTVAGELLTGKTQFGSCECRARHQDGSWRRVRASASPLLTDEGQVTGVIVSVRDITLEKKLEEQIIQSERLAAMGQMIGGFAHELNNPLTSILGMSELLQDSPVPDGARKQLEILQQQARRAVEIVQNLTYFSRPPAPGRSDIDLAELVQRTLDLHAYSLRKNNITVDFLRNTAIPAVNGDAHQLMQVFLNLVLNSEQAIREVRDRGTLRIRLEKSAKAVSVIFQDDGPGIPPEILSNIFDPFYTTKRPGRGTGLGLSICKAILREHNGNVEATSGPGGGAVFTVTLPMTESRQ